MRFSIRTFNTLLVVFLIIMFSGCGTSITKVSKQDKYVSWEDVLKSGKNKTVTIYMWGGNESVNAYMDNYVDKNIRNLYGITLRRVPMDAPVFLTKLMNEKKSNLNNGTADLIWINAENFRKAKESRILWGPYTNLLPNINKYYDKGTSDLNYDAGIPIDGYEGIWGRAQLVLTYDSSVVKNPPKSFKELLEWAKKNPGKFTYPRASDDFAGSAFIRTAYYELTGKNAEFQRDMKKEEFIKLSKPVIDYFKELNSYLWNSGKAYPADQAKQDELFRSGELFMTMGFEIGKTPGLVKKGVYPNSVRTYVMSTGTIGNSHYLAIPFNSVNKAAALLLMDFLQSPEAQMKKYKSEVWGDMPAFDVSKLDRSKTLELSKIEESAGAAALSIKALTSHRLPEMKSNYIDWIREIWINQIQGKY